MAAAASPEAIVPPAHPQFDALVRFHAPTRRLICVLCREAVNAHEYYFNRHLRKKHQLPPQVRQDLIARFQHTGALTSADVQPGSPAWATIRATGYVDGIAALPGLQCPTCGRIGARSTFRRQHGCVEPAVKVHYSRALGGTSVDLFYIVTPPAITAERALEESELKLLAQLEQHEHAALATRRERPPPPAAAVAVSGLLACTQWDRIYERESLLAQQQEVRRRLPADIPPGADAMRVYIDRCQRSGLCIHHGATRIALSTLHLIDPGAGGARPWKPVESVYRNYLPCYRRFWVYLAAYHPEAVYGDDVHATLLQLLQQPLALGNRHPILDFLAADGLGPDGVWATPEQHRHGLAHFTYLLVLVTIQECFPAPEPVEEVDAQECAELLECELAALDTAALDTAALDLAALDTNSVSAPTAVAPGPILEQFRQRYLARDAGTVFPELARQASYCAAVQPTVLPSVLWIDRATLQHTARAGPPRELRLQVFQEAYQRLIASLARQVCHVALRHDSWLWHERCDPARFRADDLQNRSLGLHLAQYEEDLTHEKQDREQLIQLGATARGRSWIAAMTQGATDAEQLYQVWAGEYAALLRHFLVAYILSTGAAIRASEFGSITWINDAHTPRGIYAAAGTVVFLHRYSKQQSIGHPRDPLPRFLPPTLARIYIVLARDVAFCRRLWRSYREPGADPTAAPFLFATDAGVPWTSAQITPALETTLATFRFGFAAGIHDWREISVALSTRYMRTAAPSAPEATFQGYFAAQAGHTLATELQHYAREGGPGGLTTETVRIHHLLAQLWWQHVLGLPPDEPPTAGKVAPAAEASIAKAPITPSPPPSPPPPRRPTVHSDDTLLHDDQTTWRSRGQLRAVMALRDGVRRILLRLPTGGGKSTIIFTAAQMHPLQVTLVVVPFVALRADLQARATAIPLSCAEWPVAPGTHEQIVLMTPEAWATDAAQAWLRPLVENGRLAAIFVDECHLFVTTDYRPAMRKVLATLQDVDAPVVLMSATVTRACEADLLAALRWEGRATRISTPTTVRENIRHQVAVIPAARWPAVVAGLRAWARVRGTRILVVAATVDEARAIAAQEEAPYVLGVQHQSAAERAAAIARFRQDAPLLVGTSTLSHGLDLPGIGLVVSLGGAFTLTQLVQQADRAARRADERGLSLTLLDHLPTVSAKEADTATSTKHADAAALRAYLTTTGCRIHVLRQQFDRTDGACCTDGPARPLAACCDNCVPAPPPDAGLPDLAPYIRAPTPSLPPSTGTPKRSRSPTPAPTASTPPSPPSGESAPKRACPASSSDASRTPLDSLAAHWTAAELDTSRPTIDPAAVRRAVQQWQALAAPPAAIRVARAVYGILQRLTALGHERELCWSCWLQLLPAGHAPCRAADGGPPLTPIGQLMRTQASGFGARTHYRCLLPCRSHPADILPPGTNLAQSCPVEADLVLAIVHHAFHAAAWQPLRAAAAPWLPSAAPIAEHSLEEFVAQLRKATQAGSQLTALVPLCGLVLALRCDRGQLLEDGS